jgi:ribosomal protein L14
MPEQTSYCWCGQHGDVKKGKPEVRKKIHPAVVIWQQKLHWRKDGVFLWFENDARVTVNNNGEMKDSAITGPVAKECEDLWQVLHPMQTELHGFPVYL